MIVHNLDKDISYDAKTELFQNLQFWGKIVIFCAKIMGNLKICVVSIFVDTLK